MGMNLITPRRAKDNRSKMSIKPAYIGLLIISFISFLAALTLFLFPQKATAVTIMPPELSASSQGQLKNMEFTLKSGDFLSSALNEQVNDSSGVYDAVDSLRNYIDLRYLKPGQKIEFTYSDKEENQQQLESVVISSGFTEKAIAIRQRDGSFRSTKIKNHLVAKPIFKEAKVNSSLYQAGLDAGVPVNRLVEMFDLFAFSVDFQRDIQPDDRFQMVYEQYYDSKGEPSGTGDILGARLVTGGVDHKAFYFMGDDGHEEYFDANGQGVKKALLLMPVQGGRLTSGFVARRNPVYGYSEFHPALDFAAPIGTPIMSAGNGTVLYRGWDPKGYGNYVMVRHTNGYITLYGHMSRFASSAKVGTRVSQGQTIGYVGSTGMSTGPHVHYEIRINKKRYNPAIVVRNMSSGRILKGDEKARFEEKISEIANQLKD